MRFTLSRRRRLLMGVHAALALTVSLSACEPSADDLVEALGDPARREDARQELLLAKDRAVGPLLEALDRPDNGPGRVELAEVLMGLALRVEDPRIETALRRHLRTDPDPRVRARIAYMAGVHRRRAFIDNLLTSGLHDSAGVVVEQSLGALEAMEGRLTAAQQEARLQAALTQIDNPHAGARWAARLLVESRAAQLVDAGRAQVLQARTARAESLFHAALAMVPDSKYAVYWLARLALDAGQRQRGLALLRVHGMLLDVPRADQAPVLDGRLDDAAWQDAARARGFYIFSGEHKAALPSQVDTEFRLTRTDRALYIGFTGYDAHPDSLVVKTEEEDGDLWREDIVEIYMDADMDHRSYVHMGINSIGVVADAWHPHGLGDQDQDYDTGVRVAPRVGRDAWWLEIEIPFSDPHLSAPGPDQLWGFNMVRTYRGSEYSQWVRTYHGAHAPDEFGVLRFP